MSEGNLVPPVSTDDHIQGPPDAPVILVEYGDYECPYCGMAYPIVKAAQRALGDQMGFVFRNFPLNESHPHAEHAAESAEAIGALKGAAPFWSMHDTLYENQDALLDHDLVRYASKNGVDRATLIQALENGTYRPRVRNDFRSGVKSGVNGTPTFFINGQRYDGSWNRADEFIDALTEVAQSTSHSARAGRQR